MMNSYRWDFSKHRTVIYLVVQVTVVKKAQESSSPDTRERIKELNVKRLSDLIVSSDGKSISALTFQTSRCHL